MKKTGFPCLCKDLLSRFFAVFKITAVFVLATYNCIYYDLVLSNM